jgi:translation initiation factor IF-2
MVVWPCVLGIIPDRVFNCTYPIVIGAEVAGGEIRVGMPIYVVEKG